MHTEQNKKAAEEEAKDKRTDFFEKREMNLDTDDEDNAGDEGFTPIFASDESVLQTPEEKEHDESIDPNENDSVEPIDTNARPTTFDKLNIEARRATGE